MDALVSQSVIPGRKKFGGAVPFAYTEQGVAMLSSVLRSERAVEVNIAIMRTFVQLRLGRRTYRQPPFRRPHQLQIKRRRAVVFSQARFIK